VKSWEGRNQGRHDTTVAPSVIKEHDQFSAEAVRHCAVYFVAGIPRTFITPLLLGLGVHLDHNYGSMFLLQQLSRLKMMKSNDIGNLFWKPRPDSVIGSMRGRQHGP